MNVYADLDRSEALLWTILSRFEFLAVEQYGATVPSLLTPEKIAVVALLRTRVQTEDELAGTQLEAPIAALVASATSTRAAHVLIAQGLFLELIGEAIYRTFGANELSSGSTRELCILGNRASGRARDTIPGLLREHIGRGDVLLQAIVDESGPLLARLDDLGEGIDAHYLDRFGVSFADLMGDVAAELIAIAIDLDVDRRKFVAFLASALMAS